MTAFLEKKTAQISFKQHELMWSLSNRILLKVNGDIFIQSVRVGSGLQVIVFNINRG